MTEVVLNLVTYIQWEKPQVIEYDKICNGLKALPEMLSIYSYIINMFIQIDIESVNSQQKMSKIEHYFHSAICPP